MSYTTKFQQNIADLSSKFSRNSEAFAFLENLRKNVPWGYYWQWWVIHEKNDGMDVNKINIICSELALKQLYWS